MWFKKNNHGGTESPENQGDICVHQCYRSVNISGRAYPLFPNSKSLIPNSKIPSSQRQPICFFYVDYVPIVVRKMETTESKENHEITVNINGFSATLYAKTFVFLFPAESNFEPT